MGYLVSKRHAATARRTAVHTGHERGFGQHWCRRGPDSRPPRLGGKSEPGHSLAFQVVQHGCVFAASRVSIRHGGTQHSMDRFICEPRFLPVSRAGVDPRVLALLSSADNCVCACRKCNSSKGDRDIFEWYGMDRVNEIPKLALSKFLKVAYKLHETQGTLDLKDPNMDGVLNIYDLGVVITNLIGKVSEKNKNIGRAK